MLQNFTLGSFAQGVSAGGGAFESIASATGTGSSGTITFSSIPSGYTSLQIRGIAKDTDTSDNYSVPLFLRFNSDTGSNYARHTLTGDGSTVAAVASISSSSLRMEACNTVTTTANNVSAFIIDIHDYASTTRNKTVRYFSGADNNAADTDFKVAIGSGLWMNTNAITSISILDLGGVNFSTQTQIALYGIKGA
jgi:hypothetical protein